MIHTAIILSEHWQPLYESETIRIFNGCAVEIENFVMRITGQWCQTVIQSNRIFNLLPTTIFHGFFFLHNPPSAVAFKLNYAFLARLNNVQEELLYYPWRWHWRLLLQMLKFYVKVFRTSLFPNPMMSLVHVWYGDRYWSKILHSTILNPLHDLKARSQTEFLY